MEWTDEGIVLGTRRHGEGNAILELMTQAHGRHLGLVRGGAGSRLRPALQPGNVLRAVWRARLDEHLGHYTVEVLHSHAASQMAAAHVVYGVTHLAALCRLLPEREPHGDVHQHLSDVLDHLEDQTTAAVLMVRFELQMLSELGFGLDLSVCAVTGTGEGLAYVSPKSGRAVSLTAGEPWRDRLLRLPAFVLDHAETQIPTTQQLTDGFALTGFFLGQHVLEPRGLFFSEARDGFISAVLGRRKPAPAAAAG